MNGLEVLAIIGLFAAFVIFADRVLDWYLAQPKAPLQWDETRQFRRQLDALEPKRVQPDYLYWADQEPRPEELGGPVNKPWATTKGYIDFRPEAKR
jgi:hypothetical protein